MLPKRCVYARLAGKHLESTPRENQSSVRTKLKTPGRFTLLSFLALVVLKSDGSAPKTKKKEKRRRENPGNTVKRKLREVGKERKFCI